MVQGRGMAVQSRSTVVAGRNSGLWAQESKELPEWGQDVVSRQEGWGQQVTRRNHLVCEVYHGICSSQEREQMRTESWEAPTWTPRGARGITEGWDAPCLS